MCKQLNINKMRTTALHPQSDGKVEEFNKTLLQHLSVVVDEHQGDWDHHNPQFMLAYWSMIHECTHQTLPKWYLVMKKTRNVVFESVAECSSSVTHYMIHLRLIWHSYGLVVQMWVNSNPRVNSRIRANLRLYNRTCPSIIYFVIHLRPTCSNVWTTSDSSMTYL